MAAALPSQLLAFQVWLTAAPPIGDLGLVLVAAEFAKQDSLEPTMCGDRRVVRG